MPRAGVKKESSAHTDLVVWTIVGAYVIGMVVAGALQSIMNS